MQALVTPATPKQVNRSKAKAQGPGCPKGEEGYDCEIRVSRSPVRGTILTSEVVPEVCSGGEPGVI